MTWSEDEWEEHSAVVTRALDGLQTTVEIFKNDCGIWTQDRLEAQTVLVHELWDAATAALCEGNAVIAGGMIGAGKTTVLTGPAGIDQNKYLVVNPDDIKQAMAEHNMIPIVNGLSPMEASPLVHEEASELAKRLAAIAYQERMNIVWDITMSSTESVRARLNWLQDAQYTSIDSVFVDVPVEVGVARATQRYRDGQEAFALGQGLGGRFIPRGFIVASMPVQSEFTSRNHQVFSEFRDEFHSTAEYDNSGVEPILRRVTGTRWSPPA